LRNIVTPLPHGVLCNATFRCALKTAFANSIEHLSILYGGSLKRKDSRRVFSLFGIGTGKSNDHLTVWFCVRELKKRAIFLTSLDF